MTARQKHQGIAEELLGYWHGEGPLWKLYWVYGVALSAIGGAFILTAVLMDALPVPLLLVCIAATLIYTAFILISIWRSAFNIATDPLGVDREAWGWIARALTFGWALNAAGASLMLLQVAMHY